MQKLKIAIIVGTSRQGRQTINVARFIEKIGAEFSEIETVFVDPREFNLPFDGNDPEAKDPKYSEITNSADGFFIVSPEYNHSFPGSLKRLLDSELKNYIHKPVAFAGVSAEVWGGVRAIEALVNTVRELGLVATFTDVNFPRVKELFSSDGEIQDPAYTKRVKRTYIELIWMAKTLKYGRLKFESKHHEQE